MYWKNTNNLNNPHSQHAIAGMRLFSNGASIMDDSLRHEIEEFTDWDCDGVQLLGGPWDGLDAVVPRDSDVIYFDAPTTCLLAVYHRFIEGFVFAGYVRDGDEDGSTN
jgi:hypothetical protein